MVQHIDPYGENVALHLREAAEAFALDLGGVVSSPIEHFDTSSLQLDGWPIFEIRRLWKGSVDEYCEYYGLTRM